MIIAALLVMVYVPMILEARRAARNERVQRSRGGIEPPGDVYALMRIAYPVLFLAILAEGVWRGVSRREVFTAGLLLFASAKCLKWWAIRALGDFWTFRVIVLPGATLVSGGPYRFVRHPNYMAVLGEFAGAALMTGARATGPLALLVFGVLLLKRIAVENRALS